MPMVVAEGAQEWLGNYIPSSDPYSLRSSGFKRAGVYPSLSCQPDPRVGRDSTNAASLGWSLTRHMGSHMLASSGTTPTSIAPKRPTQTWQVHVTASGCLPAELKSRGAEPIVLWVNTGKAPSMPSINPPHKQISSATQQNCSILGLSANRRQSHTLAQLLVWLILEP